MKRPGYYVEGKFFASRSAQAIAFAQFKADQFHRDVHVLIVEFDGKIRDFGYASPESPKNLNENNKLEEACN